MDFRKARIRAWAVCVAALAPGLTLAAAPATPPTRFPCDRACLAAHADAFFTALAAHDPSRLPLSNGGGVRERDLCGVAGEDCGDPCVLDSVGGEGGYPLGCGKCAGEGLVANKKKRHWSRHGQLATRAPHLDSMERMGHLRHADHP